MALKDIFADKTKKRTLAILGTIIIVLACAGVFWHQAASTPVKTIEEKRSEEKPTTEEKPQTEEEELKCQSDSDTDTAWPGGPGPFLIVYYPRDIFTVGNETPRNAIVKIEWVSGFGDLDLYVLDGQDNEVGSSTGAGFRNYEEVVELNAADLKKGAKGVWEMRVYYYMGAGPVTYRWSYEYYYYPA
jgi:putative component of toxin-antitoxin plasmid stabilization module